MDRKLTTAEILAAARQSNVKAGPPATHSPPVPPREFRIETRDPLAIHLELVSFWNRLADSCSSLPADTWDAIVGYMGDEGWISFGAAKCLVPFRFPRTLATIDESYDHFQFARDADAAVFVLDYAERFPELEDDDDAFERAFDELAEVKLSQLGLALQESRLPGVLEIAKAYGVFASLPGEDVHEVNLIPLLGQLPKPPAPATALEVFSRLYYQSHKFVGRYCGMKFEGDELVEVRLDGAAVTNATLALLDEVEALPEVCSNLRTIIFSFTKVSPEKAAALQQRLPHLAVVY